MSVLANIGKYHNDKCIHLSKEREKEKHDNGWLSILNTFSAVVILKGQLVVPDCLSLNPISKIISPCVRFDQNRDKTTSG